ncbi:lipid scramblase CLPTM1L-like isoform X2 [Triplophysa rosa]|uniref:Lipid scramblase CLPTM1L n=1 Tax=Triplophysa rosa TaxID=992332 RepID=A0A9W8C362_TRIRA|nr:lipid scramblase CLPTM1L-like isoform X2 [Triplophysa rosa]KAI7806352.1 putative cleft lip and palate transmembrane protein 1-like protein-like [Triplophysa rosa]
MFPSCCSKPKNGSQFKMSYTKVIFGVLVVYVVHTCWAIYGFIQTKPCDSSRGDSCVTSYLTMKPRLQLSIYSALDPNDESGYILLFKVDRFDINTRFDKKVSVTLPVGTRNNRTLHAVVFIHKSGVTPWKDNRHVRLVDRLTSQMIPLQLETTTTKQTQEATEEHKLVLYWKSCLRLNIMNEDFIFSNAGVPSDLRRYMKIIEDGKREKKKLYLPLLLVDELRSRLKDLIEINRTTKEVPLTVSYDTITLRKFRIWIHIQAVIYSLKHFGFSEQSLDEIKAMFVESGLHVLALSVLVPAFHLSFEVFAFKNDVRFWRDRKNLAGLSRRSVLWRCFSTIVIFLHLLEEQSSWLILLPTGIAALIELWKVNKVIALSPKFHDERLDDFERATEEYDSKAMKFLSYLMYPLCISGAIYSYLYLQNKSWYSWITNGLISGVYAFGFLSMVPQLFINYKLKSVAHLQMSTLMYKGLNTFISDVFSGIITTPGPHQLACFRDDVVFLVYLYQRRIYPMSKSRSRDYGSAHRRKAKGKSHED